MTRSRYEMQKYTGFVPTLFVLPPAKGHRVYTQQLVMMDIKSRNA